MIMRFYYKKGKDNVAADALSRVSTHESQLHTITLKVTSDALIKQIKDSW